MMKMITHNILAGHKPVKNLVLALLIMLTVAGCKKDTTSAPTQSQDGSTLNFVLQDNFDFSVAYGAFGIAGLADTLAKPGPYTVICPSNEAFLLADIAAPVSSYSFEFYGKNQMQNMMRYCVLHGRIAFKALPLIHNKPFATLTGGNIYISKYLNGTDTVTTVNGFKLVSQDNPASNGLIQVNPQFLNAEVYHTAKDYIHTDTAITLFAAAMQRANLDVSLLSDTVTYTLLAPSNAAFQQSAKLGLNLGISTLDSILIADPVKLTAFLKCHIIKGRYFEGDLYTYGTANPTGIAALNGNKIIIGGNPVGFHSLTFLGSGDKGIASAIATPATYNPSANYADIPCGNGVVHIINRVLIP